MGSSTPLSQPEILPPAAMPEERRPRPMWRAAPATHLLVGINCLVFLLMVARGISIWSPTASQLLQWGGNNAASVLQYGEWGRIVSAIFVHVGLIHLATNMWCLWNLGLLAEPLLGSMGLFAAYILTGAAGNLLSTLVNQISGRVDTVGAGASGAVFGLAGVLIVLLKSPLLPIPQIELRKLRRSVIYFAGLNFLIGAGSMATVSLLHVSIDNMAHAGGFCCGLLFAAPLVPRLGSPRPRFLVRRRIAVVSVTALLVLFGFYLAQLPG